MNFFKIVFLLNISYIYLFGVDAELDIIRKNSIIPKIAVVAMENSDEQIVIKLNKIIKNDLSVSGHFDTKDIQLKLNNSDSINYLDPIVKELDLILFVDVKKNGTNYIIETELVDINTKELRSKNKYSMANINRYPFLAHKIAIDINSFLNAPSIDWMNRFVIFSRYISSKQSEIVIADYTLTYQKVLVSSGLNIFPKWANKEQSAFYYTSYEGLYPTLVKQNLYTSKSEKLLKSDGMLVCSDVSKDGKKLLITMAPQGQPDIYLYDVDTKLKTKITNYSGIDVAGNFVENDSKVVFVSDRLGKANIFAKSIGQSSVERLVFHGGNNSQATTFKDYIVYSSRETTNEFGYNTFNLYLISTKSDGIRRLTTRGVNQFPKFSTDGESILYIKNNENKSYLGIIRINYAKSFLFALKSGKLQSIDW